MGSIIESIRFWAPFVVVFWLLGFFSNKFRFDNEYLAIPKWFYYFCGAPNVAGLPKGMVTRSGVGSHLIAFFQLIFALFFDHFFKGREVGGFVGLWSSLLCTYFVIRILLHRSSSNS